MVVQMFADYLDSGICFVLAVELGMIRTPSRIGWTVLTLKELLLL